MLERLDQITGRTIPNPEQTECSYSNVRTAQYSTVTPWYDNFYDESAYLPTPGSSNQSFLLQDTPV
jgi:hypothetical protein